MKKRTTDSYVILQKLTEHEVDFIVVGGVCAVFHGAPLFTFDLDLVHSRAPDNIDRLLKALADLDAYYREHIDRRLRPRASSLATQGHHLLMTSAGPLDLLGAIGDNRIYEDLLSESLEIEISGKLKVCILNLDMLIQTKEEAGRDKDKLALAVLRQTLKEKQKRKE